MMRFPALLVLLSLSSAALAQQALSVPSAAAAPALDLSGPSGRHISLSVTELHAMPHQTVTVHNAHSNADETYQGVALATLLARMETPLGAKLHGTALAMYVVAVGADRYRAVYSLAEVDPDFHSGVVIVADTVNNQPIDAKEGPLKLVNTEDKRPARWVRNLVGIQVAAAP